MQTTVLEPVRETKPKQPPKARLRRRWVWIAVPAAAAVLSLAAWLLLRGGGDEVSLGPVATVQRGLMIVSVTEAGEVEADRRRVIQNELAWAVVIKQIASEGANVKDGQIIAEFECKELMDAIEQQRLTVNSATNDHAQASENLTLKKKDRDYQIRKGKQAVSDAKEDQKRYLEAEWPVAMKDAEGDVKLADRDYRLAQDQLDSKVKINEDPELNAPYSKNEIEADRLGVERLKLALERAITERDTLIKYDNPRMLRDTQMAVEDAELELEKAKLEAETEVLKAESEEQSKKMTMNMQVDKLRKLEEDATKLLVRAEREGLVVYDMGRRYSPNFVVAVGEKVEPRQQIMIIPDMSTLQVKTRVYEAMIEQVKVGQIAYVKLDAKPDLLLPGKITKVAVLPDSQNRWLNPEVKVFDVIVQIDGMNSPSVVSQPSEPASQPAVAGTTQPAVSTTMAASAVAATQPVTQAATQIAAAPNPSSTRPSTSAAAATAPAAAKVLEGLKPGMSAQVELMLARLTDVLSVPVAAVFTEQEQTYCYKVANGKPVRTAVKVGRMNDKRVEIVSGLSQGDQVLLAPPSGANPTQKAETQPAKPADLPAAP